MPSLQMPRTFPQTDFICDRFIYFKLLWHPIQKPPANATLRGGEEAGYGATWDQALIWAPNLPGVKNSGPFKMLCWECRVQGSPPPRRTARSRTLPISSAGEN